MIAREAVLRYQMQNMTMHVCVVLRQPCAQKHTHTCHTSAVPPMPMRIAMCQRLSGSISGWRAYKVVLLKFLFSPYGKTVCPSGLRGWTQVPLARAAWVRIPQLSVQGQSALCVCARAIAMVRDPHLNLQGKAERSPMLRPANVAHRLRREC